MGEGKDKGKVLGRVKAALEALGWNAADLHAVTPELAQSTVWNYLSESRPETDKTKRYMLRFLECYKRGDYPGAPRNVD